MKQNMSHSLPLLFYFIALPFNSAKLAALQKESPTFREATETYDHFFSLYIILIYCAILIIAINFLFNYQRLLCTINMVVTP